VEELVDPRPLDPRLEPKPHHKRVTDESCAQEGAMISRLRHLFTRSNPPPTPSPVPWIDDLVWAVWSRWPAKSDDSPIWEPRLREATEDDRRRAARRPPRGIPGPTGSSEQHARTLAGTPPAALGILRPCWPICCSTLTTLINSQGAGEALDAIEATAGPLDTSHLEADLSEDWTPKSPQHLAEVVQIGYREEIALMRRDGGLGDGFNVFQCRRCGRVYIASCET